MKVLLDECLPRKLAGLVAGHEVRTVAEVGWAGTKNGKLLALAAEDFDVFVTADRNLAFQQPIARLPIAVVVIVAPTNQPEDLAPAVPALLAALGGIEPGGVRQVGP